MAATIPESHLELLQLPIYSVLTTVMPDGHPQSTVVWFDYDGEYVRVNTTLHRQKYRNFQRDPRVTILMIHPENPFYWIEVRGEVTEMTVEGGADHIDQLSRRYTGMKYYGGYTSAERANQETRVICKIRLKDVNTYGRKGHNPAAR